MNSHLVSQKLINNSGHPWDSIGVFFSLPRLVPTQPQIYSTHIYTNKYSIKFCVPLIKWLLARTRALVLARFYGCR